MTKPVVPHNAFIFVGDGRKAMFLRNDGDEKFANFVTEQVFVDEETPADLKAGKQSRWHELEEHRFTQRVMQELEKLARDRRAPALVIVAPPRALADLREAMHDDVKSLVRLEINKDLTKQPVWEIEKHVMAQPRPAA